MMENDWRHSQCSKVELNLRVTGNAELEELRDNRSQRCACGCDHSVEGFWVRFGSNELYRRIP
jgi:hypothetical protein